MSENKQLIYEIVSDFIMAFKKSDGRDSIRELLARCSQSNVKIEELIYIFAHFIKLRYNWYLRNASDGSGRVKEISFEKDVMTITSWDDDWFEYIYHNGYRWRTRGGLISRNKIWKIAF